MLKRILSFAAFWLLVSCTPSSTTVQEPTDPIRVNQVGFYPGAPKTAVVVGAPDTSFYLVDTASGDTVKSGTLGPAQHWDLSGETVRRATFSDVTTPGSYEVMVPTVGASPSFAVKSQALRPVAQAALKGYYYQRASTALSNEHAGRWARPAGHPDDSVLVHASAASPDRPEGQVIQAPRGWYDAGDYNKYIVNSGISTYTLLALYEHYPEAAAALSSDIPESGNERPDVLDEALWNLEWMMDMQAPDGGVYHKLTHASFSGMVMPHELKAPRYVVRKSTAAALDFASVMAQAARVLSKQGHVEADRTEAMERAAVDAWSWARRNPDVVYDQQGLNDEYSPDITTGTYGAGSVDDEFAWAAAELAVTTGADSFLTVASPLDEQPSVPSWPNVRTLGWYTLLEYQTEVASVVDTTALTRRYLAFADRLVEAREEVPYGTVMGHSERDFRWGSNAVAGNQAMALLQAHRLTSQSTYREAALANLDYLLGRNATGYSFVTDSGNRSPMHIHHRPSEADAVEAPVPGLLAGGPNSGQQDQRNCNRNGVEYPSDRPARSYVDALCSYASNEIAINWNAPLVYVATVLDASYSE